MSNCPVCLGIPGYEIHMCGRVDEQRPSTPVGWSDTDWIKHLEEKRHPLDCNHINQGSADAAADAYEAEYKDAKIAKLRAEIEQLKKAIEQAAHDLEGSRIWGGMKWAWPAGPQIKKAWTVLRAALGDK